MAPMRAGGQPAHDGAMTAHQPSAAWVLVPEEGATESIAAGLLHGRAR